MKMAAQYAHLDGRRYVNAEFVGKVRETYPATTKKIPLGYSTYTGWTGKDEVLFTEHSPLDDRATFDGQIYEVTFDPVNPAAFEEDILGRVAHTTLEPKKAASESPRRRLSHGDDPVRTLAAGWGETLGEALGRQAKTKYRSAQRAKRAAWLRDQLSKVEDRKRKTATENAPATVDEWIAWDPSDA